MALNTSLVNTALFAERRTQLQLRRFIGVAALGLFLAAFVWVIATWLHLSTQTFTWQNWIRALSVPLGLKLLTLGFAIYRLRVHPWHPDRVFTHEDLDPLAMFRASAWLALEQGRKLADTLQRPLGVAHIVLGCFVTQEGSSVLARLGMSFDAIQQPFIELVRAGEPTAEQATSSEVETLLQAARLLALEEGEQQGITAVELLRAAFAQDHRLAEALERAGADIRAIDGISRWLRLQAALKADHDRFTRAAATKPDTGLNRTMTARFTPLLNQLSEDLTSSAKQGLIAPVIERAEAWTAAVRAWESGQRTLVVVGPEGVGKTAFIEDLARRMVEEQVPAALVDKRLVSVHVPELVTGADASVISERLLQLTREVAQSGNVILVLEGMEALSGAGYGGTRDLFELLSGDIERLGLFVIATVSPEGWRNLLEERVFGKRAAKIVLNPPETEVAEAIFMAHAGGLEYKHQVFFTYAALQVALDTAHQVSSGLVSPGNALTWLREAAAATRREHGERALVGREEVARVIEEKTGIPATAVQEDEAARLLRLEDALKARVIGQDEAVTAVAQALRRARADVREGHRPLASFLFLGSTGVGKTELAKALAREYFGAEERMIRFDCSEYQAASSNARLIGEPQDPKGGLLTEAIRQKPYALILLDELEKAHPDVLTLFLQVLDDGRLTDGVGRTVDFSHTLIIATSNAAAGFIQEQIGAGTNAEQLRRLLLERELKKTFRPEFLNRFDGVQVFRPLTLDDVTRIAWLLLRGLEKRLEERGLRFRADDQGVEALAHDGYDPEFGARPLRRLIQDRLETAIADFLLKKQAKRGDTIVLDAHGQVSVEAK